MGFSSSLQGETAHEALLARQDAELRLLENMKRCLALRIKCDREYAISLNTAILQVRLNRWMREGDIILKSFVVPRDDRDLIMSN